MSLMRALFLAQEEQYAETKAEDGDDEEDEDVDIFVVSWSILNALVMTRAGLTESFFFCSRLLLIF